MRRCYVARRLPDRSDRPDTEALDRAPPRQPVWSATKREFCNEKEKVRTPDGRRHHDDQVDAKGSLFRGFRLTKTVTCADSLVTADNRALSAPTRSDLVASPHVTNNQGTTALPHDHRVIPTESPCEPGSRAKAMIRDRPRYASVVLRFHRAAVSIEGILDQPRKGVVGVRDLRDTADRRSDSRLSCLRNLGRKPGTGVAHGSTFFPIRKSVTA